MGCECLGDCHGEIKANEQLQPDGVRGVRFCAARKLAFLCIHRH